MTEQCPPLRGEIVVELARKHCPKMLGFDDVPTWIVPFARAVIDADRALRGEVVVTKNDAGQIVAVTRQDDEGRILSVVAESAPWAQRVPDEWKLAPVKPTYAMLCAAQKYDWENSTDPTWEGVYTIMLSAAPQAQPERKPADDKDHVCSLCGTKGFHKCPVAEDYNIKKFGNKEKA